MTNGELKVILGRVESLSQEAGKAKALATELQLARAAHQTQLERAGHYQGQNEVLRKRLTEQHQREAMAEPRFTVEGVAASAEFLSLTEAVDAEEPVLIPWDVAREVAVVLRRMHR